MDIFDEILATSDCTDEEEVIAKAKEDDITRIYIIEYLSLSCLRAIVALVVLYYVFCRYQRREAFLTLVPLLLFISAAD